ncbi:SusC/RagA family TonB-linked outer membrane protein [Dyadobacter fanqingshengii]|uniref:TonB-dependent receptor n=1 Tax=Dyadobacter fanqingshengii TaxID=2906443 RepID=A0A9X1PAI4_9BACT|nr:TonB-dependent receptor [Dyadobacter fanqingshengii]MCF0041381.1 TonB-dependent receptor [Dyadobacter fanqingshengii]USJ36898.1 TonB-dependent receptor [Dyadobacter fanqingshengii]
MRKRITMFIAMILAAASLANAQEIVVKGVIRDQQNQTLPGASVLVKGTQAGTVTDVDGNYSIGVPNGEAVLVVSFIGYETKEIAVGNQTQIDVILGGDLKTLNEVVVIGYGTQKRGDVTTSIASVNTKDIEERPILQAAQALQGKAAGVQVTQPSGKPGAALSIRVRGATSVQAGNEPLYVVDGVPTMDTRDLNVNDIESIQVLKDASSAAIYGARASNGVVIVTTKRGKANQSQVNFSAYYGFSNMAKQIDVLNPQQYADLMNEMGNDVTVGSETTDWNKEVFTTGHNQNYQLNFSGGTDKNRYFVSGAITQDKGIIQPASYRRYSFRMNLDNEIKSWFKLTTNISYSNARIRDVKDNNNAGRNAVVLGALGAPPTMGVYSQDSIRGTIFSTNPLKAGWDNPLAAMFGPTQSAKDNRIFGNVAGDFTVAKGLVYRSNFGIDFMNHANDYYLDPYRTTEGWGANGSTHGLGNATRSNSFTYLWENTLNYEKKWDKHEFSALAGTTVQKNNWNNSYMAGRDFPSDGLVKTINAANEITDAYTEQSEWFLNSYLGRLMYNFDSRYLITANFRADGSSKLAKGNQWGFFPSVSAGWRISAEPFMQDVNFITDLKLRGGWGQNGNQEGLANYASYGLNTYTRRTPTVPPSGPAVTGPAYAPNPDLRWETTTQTNIGIDLSMLQGRLTFTADAYLKKTNDLLLNVPLPNTSGYSYMPRNSGKLENKGLEFVLSSINFDKSDFQWTTDFNIAFNRNKITELQLSKVYRYADVEGRSDQIIILQEGASLGTFYGYISDGVNPETGDMIYRDVNEDGSFSPSDRTILGSAQPKFTYGMNNNLTFKNISVSFLFQGSQGNKAFNASRLETEGMYDSKNQSTEVLRRWQKAGDITDIPRATDGNVNNSLISSRFIEDASFLRMKSTTISYAFSKSFAEKIKLGRASVYVTAQNLFTLTKYKGFDPEVNAFTSSGATLGIDYGTYPVSRAFVAGLNVSF